MNDGQQVRETTDGSAPGTAIDGGGDPSVTVTVALLHQDGQPVGFHVSDDGTGIPPEKHGDVFDSGYSTDSTGTGFGLTIVEQIAQVHDWEVKATESESGGARLEFVGVEVLTE